jgi:Rrf2 family protein
MKLSTRVRYAVRAVIDLGLHCDGNLVLLKDIAKRQGVSIKYLENIFASLRAANIVRGVRGAKGGYTLARDAEEITIHDIVLAMQGFISPIGCADDACACRRAENCDARDIWVEVSHAITMVLKKYSVANLVARHRAQDCNQECLGPCDFAEKSK